ncbi:MAG: choice-of-anchor tandem repeat GloVer-containing protein [Bryobacteraceae bacterium]
MRKLQKPGIACRTLGMALLLFVYAPVQASAQKPKTLYRFNGSLPSPYGGVAIGPGGVLYGTTYDGGANGSGTVFSLTPPASPGGAWTEQEIFEFGSTGPIGPMSGVTTGKGGVLYGTTYAGGALYQGTVFSLTPPAVAGGAWSETVLHSFAGGSASDGAVPWAGVAIDENGNLFGTTVAGGDSLGYECCGSVYELTPPSSPGGTWTETILCSFSDGDYGLDPSSPYGGVVIGEGGVLYGTTYRGGTYAAGTVYSLTPPASGVGPWTIFTLYNFKGKGDGIGPYTDLTIDSKGVLYGTTSSGGTGTACSNGCGTVFSLTPPYWTEEVLYSFTGGSDGWNPQGRLAIGSGLVLYGATIGGGNPNGGTIFSLTPPPPRGTAWTWKPLFAFNGTTNGDWPSPLAIGTSGTLYGTTYGSPSTAFELIP